MSALTVAVFPFDRGSPVPRWPGIKGRGLALRAAAWLRENLSEPPTIQALCTALGTSERTLHEAFREHLHATPKAYLKVLRLRAAHRDLLQADQGVRVTDVALDYGFLHFGWFSQDYKRLFGEAPSQTLRRAHTLRPTRAQPPPWGPIVRDGSGNRRDDGVALSG